MVKSLGSRLNTNFAACDTASDVTTLGLCFCNCEKGMMDSSKIKQGVVCESPFNI